MQIESVSAVGGFRLSGMLKNGEAFTADLRDLVHRRKAFAPLRDPAAFAKVELLNHGRGIAWPDDGLDLCADTLHCITEARRRETYGT